MGPEYHQIENDALSFSNNETTDEDQLLSNSSDETVDSDNEKGSDGYYCERSGEPSNCEGSEAVDISVFLSCNYLFIN